MNHLALFNGIGGFQIAADWMGWNNVAHVEIDSWCNKIVKRHFPESKCHTDIRKFNGKEYAGRIDIISGGVPCQPASIAGKRKGEADDRWLWDEAIRVIGEVKPGYAIFENPVGILSLENGNPFERICSEMESQGYKVTPVIIPACGVGAWHRRDRVWIICNSTSSTTEKLHTKGSGGIGVCVERNELLQKGRYKSTDRFRESDNEDAPNPHNSGSRKRLHPDTIKPQDDKGRQGQPQPESCKDGQDATDPNQFNDDEGGHGTSQIFRKGQMPSGLRNSKQDTSNSKRKGLQGKPVGQMEKSGKFTESSKNVTNTTIQRQPKQRKSRTSSNTKEKGKGEINRTFNDSIRKSKSGLGGMANGIPPELDGYWDREPDIQRTTKVTKDRINRIKGLGNAIVPQVAFEIFKAIEESNG